MKWKYMCPKNKPNDHWQTHLVWENLLGKEISVVLIAMVMQYITIIIAEKILPKHIGGQCLILVHFIYTFLGHFYFDLEV